MSEASVLPHYLLTCFPAHGHINPTLHLAQRLLRAGARVTFSTTISAHRRMFPSNPTFPVADTHQPLLAYHPHSDAYDGGFDWQSEEVERYMSQLRTVGAETVGDIVTSLAATAHPISCIIYSITTAWAAEVASRSGVPAVLFWVQPVTVFGVYYHYFRGYKDLIDTKDPSSSVELPGLPPLRTRDLPTVVTRSTDYKGVFYPVMEELFARIESARPLVLLNSFEALEHDSLVVLSRELALVPIGPLISRHCLNDAIPIDHGEPNHDLAKASSDNYVEWLDTKQERSVVYVSFGSYQQLPKRWLEEISRALLESRRSFLWVAKGQREDVVAAITASKDEGVVVDWCSQAVVLSHTSVGCFVTHCGWNSTLEALACGVPTVGCPIWMDQTTIGAMVDGVWGTGVRVEVDGDGDVDAKELRRCLDVVMGDDERGAEIRRKAQLWKTKAREAVRDGGPSDLNLKAFVEGETPDLR